MLLLLIALALPALVLAAVSLPDLDDVIPRSVWAADGAIVPSLSSVNDTSLIPNVLAQYPLTGTRADRFLVALSTTQDNTSVVAASNAAYLGLSMSKILKEGFGGSPDLVHAWGNNAAINLASGSQANIQSCNLTMHNGAVGIFSSGGSWAAVSRSSFYGTGPVGHSLMSASGGVIVAESVTQLTNGILSSAFATGTNGSTTVRNALAHTVGVGSPVLFAVGVNGRLHGERIMGNADASPIAILDGPHELFLSDSFITGAGVGGIVATNAGDWASTSTITLNNTWLGITGPSTPAIWAGNCRAFLTIYSSRITTDSGVLVAANQSQLDPSYANYGDNHPGATPSPGYVNVDISYSNLRGDITAYMGSHIVWALHTASIWTGATYPVDGPNVTSVVDVVVSQDSQWQLTHDSRVQNFFNDDTTLSNIVGNGFNITYQLDAPLNSWLGGRTIPLQGGGFAAPY